MTHTKNKPRRNKHRLARRQPSDIIAGVILVASTMGMLALFTLVLQGKSPAKELPPTHFSPSEEILDTNSPQATKPDGTESQQRGIQNNGSASAAQEVNTKSPITLLRFTNDSALRGFMKINSLDESELSYIGALNLYSTSLSNPTMSAGSQTVTNHTYTTLLTPTDTLYGNQWYLPAIQAPAAWNEQFGSATVTTAIIDTGFALSHEDLSSRWAVNINEMGISISEGAAPNCTSRMLTLNKSCNNIDDDNDGYIDNHLGWNFASDTNSPQAGQGQVVTSSAAHGTLVAGIIGAMSNNAAGISGLDWRAKLLPIQALDDTGSGTTLSVAQAVHYAVTHGARVINLSLGSSESDPILAEQIQYALDQGVTVVTAAGNDGCDCISYPARYPGVIAVGATTSSSQRASFSSFGSQLSLVAPGASICSTAWTSQNGTNLYGCGYNGTSFSSPLVAASASILIAQNRSLTPMQVKASLTAGASKLSAMSGQNRTDHYGSGLLSITKSIELVSLPAPTGSILNIHNLSLQAQSTSSAYDNMNTTCVSSITALCRVRAINLATNEVVSLEGSSSGSFINIYWTAQAAQLGIGSWAIQIYVVTDTSNSLVQQEVLTISP